MRDDTCRCVHQHDQQAEKGKHSAHSDKHQFDASHDHGRQCTRAQARGHIHDRSGRREGYLGAFGWDAEVDGS